MTSQFQPVSVVIQDTHALRSEQINNVDAKALLSFSVLAREQLLGKSNIQTGNTFYLSPQCSLEAVREILTWI